MNEPDSPCAGIAGTSDLVDCLLKAKAKSEKKMNSVFQQIMDRLKPTEVERLTEAQNLWSRYREANCSAERSLYGRGTGGPPAYLACLESMARARAKELRVTYAVRLK
jgi:uncharacterized protein YecT (DUF1311 family)